MNTRFAIFLIAFFALFSMARGQNGTENSRGAACPAATQVSHLQLYGLWQARFDGQHEGASLRLEKHPDYPHSVKGALLRGGVQSLCVGDVDQGIFSLEESDDGHNITASWSGTVVDGSCGKEISGTWKNISKNTEQHFVLRKQPGWH